MNRTKATFRALLLLSLAGVTAPAAILFDLPSDSIFATDATMTGRLSRNGVAQDWSGDEAFPGVINTTTTYNYKTYSLNVGVDSFIQIDMDSVSANTFASAYSGFFLPDSAGLPDLGFDTNWLGDAGTSGNFFGTDPVFFQVQVPVDGELVVVINTTAAGAAGLNQPFHLTVEGYIDSEYDDAPTTPEPSSALLLGSGFMLVALTAGYRKSRASRKPAAQLQ
jgi:hypothetical protein